MEVETHIPKEVYGSLKPTKANENDNEDEGE